MALYRSPASSSSIPSWVSSSESRSKISLFRASSCQFDHITNDEVDDGFKLTIYFEGGKSAYIEVGTYNFISMPRFYMQAKDGSAFIEDWQKKCKVAKLKAWCEKDVLPVQTAAGITKTMAPRDELTIKSYEIERPTSDVHDFYRNVALAVDGKAEQIVTADEAVVAVQAGGQMFDCKWVILATGGVSYPTTGSTGDGYRFAKELGHTVVPAEGSLVPLETAGNDCQRMQGLSLRNVSLTVFESGKKIYTDFGEMLFTHFGVSGPMVLSASAHIGKGDGWKISIDLKPALEEGKLDDRILRDLEMYQNRSMENALTDLLPRSMIPVVLRRIGVDGSLQANSFTKQNRRALVELLKSFTLEITGKRPVAEAIITSGGVKCGEIDPKTMESKKVPGLYFAGEIIDCDAYTGGFNLQIAWATGVAAGKAVAE